MAHTTRWLALVVLLAYAATVWAAPTLHYAQPARLQLLPSPLTAAGDHLTLSLDTPDGPLTLELEPATALATAAARWVPAVRDGRTRVFRGHVAGYPRSWLRMTQVDGAWLGAIQLAGRLWLLDPARQHPDWATALGVTPEATLLIDPSDVSDLHFDSGGRAAPATTPSAHDWMPVAGKPQASPYYLGVTLVLDTEYQNFFGSNAQSTAVGILNIADGFYSAQADTQVYLYAMHALPAGNNGITATDAETLLNQFSSFIYNTPSIPFSGLAHLLSGKNFDGSTIGLAWLGTPTPGYIPTLCNRGTSWPGGIAGGTGVDQVNLGSAIAGITLAHEMGHNHGAEHDGDGNACPATGFIMAADAGNVNDPPQFSSCSLNYFNAYRSAKNPTCLNQAPDLIFQDSFE